MDGAGLDRRSFLKAAGASAAWALLPPVRGSALTASIPWTIPALREWAPRSGAFTLRPSTRIVARTPELLPEASLLAGDIARLTGLTPGVAIGGALAQGDVGLGLTAADAGLGLEGYRFEAGETIVISANAAEGAFYGTRTLLQLLRQSNAIPAGVARDWPRYAHRGLMVDIGRQHFSVDWLAARIEEIAYLKLNYLHLHFTENLGWRIGSETHPEVVSDEHLTKDQVRGLIELAARHHVAIVPEIDMPGHMGAALAAHPELQLRDALGRANPNNLDYTLPDARRFAFELIEEYLDLFPGPVWHTGADEYLITIPAVPTPIDYTLYPHLQAYARERYGRTATPKDGILGFVNEVNELVRAHGKTLRVYNDGLSGGRAVTLSPDIEVEWWTDRDGPTPAALLAAGHRIHNIGWFPTYYVNGFPGGFIPGYPSEELPILPPRPSMRSAYESWDVHRFYGPLYLNADLSFPPQIISPDEPGNRGSRLLIWNDDPTVATEEQIAAGIAPRLRVIAQKTWELPLLTPSYREFQTIIDRVGGPP